MYEVYDPLQLPFAAQCMVEKAGVSVVVAIGFLVADAHWCSKEVRHIKVTRIVVSRQRERLLHRENCRYMFFCSRRAVDGRGRSVR